MLVQVYVNDIIFGSIKKSWCDEFEALMKNRFQMSSMGELTFFLGLQVKQKKDGIFISHDKYVAEILKKFDFLNVMTASTSIETKKPLVKDEEAAAMDVHLYRSMIGSLMYLTASRPDIMNVVCAYFRFQVNPKTSHLRAVKRIFRHHFIRDAYEKKLIQELKIHTDDNVVDLLTKAFDVSRLQLKEVWLDLKSCCWYEGSFKCWLITTPKMVINSPCLTDKKELAIPRKQKLLKVNAARLKLTTARVYNAKGTSCLTNTEIFEGLAKIGYEKPSDKPIFYKAFFSLLWKFVQLIINHQLGDMAHHKEIFDTPSLTKNVFANMKRVGTGFSREVTLLSDNMLVQAPEEVGILQADAQLIPINTEPSTSKPQKKHKPKKKHTQESEVPLIEFSAEQNLPSPSNDPLPSVEDILKLKELMDLCTNLSNKVLDLKSEVIDINPTYQERIEKLEGKVERLEEENMVLKELKSVHSTNDANEPVMEKEKSSKQGRKIVDIDADVEINLEKAQAEAYNLDLDHQEKVLSMMDVNEEEPADVEEVLEVV
uniref:Ribonuclease H-like domain, reverse transcriptase, RNA-dependent DNA polymerase n=1 Tax=Tanacetum cinerariifolium TaxID=118510 RepID=A0A6L2N534_TANCI|nr:ribonuclease H-like domain, reverse transcriptase, RNA-dependent DNA polymerase [Tanacetum cinerariifolium]